MKLPADLSVEGLFIRVEKVERHQSQHDREGGQNRLERWTQEEIQTQAEFSLLCGNCVESIPQAVTHFEFRETDQRLRSFLEGGEKQRTAFA